MKRRDATEFEKLQGTATITSEPTWNAGATVYDISTDCLNVALQICGNKQVCNSFFLLKQSISHCSIV